MCGIAGVVGEVGPDHRDAVRAMCAAMRHRGPDDEGFLDRDGVSLGMRRLAIIDVAGGRQPVLSEDGQVAAVFNGEIYNYPELQRGLRARGHTLASESDSECLPHLYEEHGSDLLQRLRGMFALALWDAGQRRLLLARDRVGKKPLYVWHDGPRLWFASELKCLLTVPGCPRELDPVAVDQYLTYQYVPAPRSIIAGIRKLPPAHLLTWQDGRIDTRRYWRLQYPPEGTAAPAPEPDLAEQLRDRLVDATRIRMASQRPLGAFLSGGLDSAAVVAAMARTSDRPVKTFSIGFADERFNELPYARRVAELYDTEHHELVVDPDIGHLLPQVARMFDEPFADSSAVPSFLVAQLARQDVVVVLTGDGGDESLGGYERYPWFLRSGATRTYPPALTAAAARAGLALQRHAAGRPAVAKLGRRLSRAAAADPATRYTNLMSYFLAGEREHLYRPEFARQLAGADEPLIAGLWAHFGHADPVNRLLGVDVESYLPGDLLAKVDVTTMAVSLEARSPLLDHELMEWAAGLPGHLKVRGSTTKYLFKQALAPWLPDDLIHRAKQGFGIPRDDWLRGPLRPLVGELLLAGDSHVGDYLRADVVRDWVARHDDVGLVGSQLWALLMLELWHREVQAA